MSMGWSRSNLAFTFKLAFALQESNFTTFGSEKELLFLNKFRSGWMKEYQKKIAYVFLSHFTDRGKENGWYADAYIRYFMLTSDNNIH